jgi:hypothetical protein
LETVRKTKITQEPATDETVTEENDVVTIQETCTAKNVFDEAPELFGINPTAQQIDEYRQKEIVWRKKLQDSLQ